MQQDRMSGKAVAAGAALGLLLAGQALHGQALALPASDPVGIARSGAEVAFGRSLEAASLNPALLVTLQDSVTAYLGLGMEQSSAQVTPQSNQLTSYTTDRNRFAPSFGAAWRLNEGLSLGLKVDQPFLRHGELPVESPARFMGTSLDLNTQRLEFQAGWSPKGRPDLSFGVGLGLVRVKYASSATLRALLPVDQTAAASGANPVQDLMEVEVGQEASKVVPSATLGFRYAINPRWTLGAVYQSPVKGTLSLTASRDPKAPVYYATDGYGAPLAGEDGSVLLAHSTYQAGKGDFTLPGRMSVGVRNRLTQFFTWEADLRYVWSASLRFPDQPTMTTPSGVIVCPAGAVQPKSGFGVSAMGEVAMSKRFTIRVGAAMDPATYADQDVRPLTGGSACASFSAGFGYLIWGGEVNVGYQFRQSKDHDTVRLNGNWRDTGYYAVGGGSTRVEGMGHLWSIGFKKAF